MSQNIGIHKIVIGSAFGAFLFSSQVSAQGYAGALITMSRVADGCIERQVCDQTSMGLRAYAGSTVAPEESLRFGNVRVASFELGLMRTGKASSSGDTTKRVIDDGGEPVSVPAKADAQIRATAMTAAAVFEAPIVPQIMVTGRLGLAYVSATADFQVDGVSIRSRTENVLSPYAALGLGFMLSDRVKLVGSVDALRYRVAGQSGVIRQIGFGAEARF
jgi:hypothetical protein